MTAQTHIGASPSHPGHAAAPVGGRLVTPVTVILAALALGAGIVLIERFALGLGAVTNLNDGYPWGIWIAYDVVVGTAFACGGYAMALLVYIFNKGEYHPLVRPALLASLFGYTLGGVSVIFDLGRYWNAWHIFLPGWAQVNSVMFEVAVCIAAYIVVMWIEFTPAFLERLGMKDIRRKLNKVLFAFIALGVLLPTMHQSSLGSLLVVFGHQVHPLWQTMLLPGLFLISAVTMGFSIVVFESILAARAFRRPIETPLLSKLARLVMWMMAAFLGLRLLDIVVQGKFGLVLGDGLHSAMFVLEVVLFGLPILLFARPEGRKSPRLLFIGAVSMLLGGALYRIDGFLVAYQTGPGWQYFPSVQEILVTVGIIAFEILAYIVFVRTLPVLHAEPSPAADR